VSNTDRRENPEMTPMRNFLCGLLLVLAPATASAADELNARDNYKRCVPSVAFVLGAEIEKGAHESGTAFVVDAEQRLLLTCHHVARNAETVRLLFPTWDSRGRVVAEKSTNFANATWITARVLAVDAPRDLVLLQAESLPVGALTLPMAAEEPEPGEEQDLIGCPGVSEALFVYSGGRVRQTYRRKWTAVGDAGWKSELDSRVVESYVMGNGGDSGAPVFNGRGELTGMHQGRKTKTADGAIVSVMAYAISVEELKRFLTEHAPKPALRPVDPFQHLFGPTNPFPSLQPSILPPARFDPLFPSLPPLEAPTPGTNGPSPWTPRPSPWALPRK
jgi:S1-C subfamily serine protease